MSLMGIIITLLMLSAIVTVHEWGHFKAACLCNINVEEFAVGMGPKIISKTKKGVIYSLRAFPIGGFCRMSENSEEAPEGKTGFNDASLPKRIFVSFAGPFMNFVTAFILVILVVMFTGISTLNVTDVTEDGAAKEAGIISGDRIISYNGHYLLTRNDLSYYLGLCKGEEVTVTVNRNGQLVTTKLTPKFNEEYGSYLLGVGLKFYSPLFNISGTDYGETEKANPFSYIGEGVISTISYIKLTCVSVMDIIKGTIPFNQLSGPIGMAGMVDDVYEQSVRISIATTIIVMLEISALVSVSLGFMNLLPLPALDGGRIIIYVFEIILKREIPEKIENAIHLTGFVLLLALGVFVAASDIFKLMH